MKLRSIEILEDRTAASRCDEGFLRLQRLVLRNHYEDGSTSRPYPCDVVSRRATDAVVAVLYRIDEQRQVRVILREAPRAPIYLRRFKALEHPDPRPYDRLIETVAGVIEGGDGPGAEGLRRRASAEAHEEAGLVCAAGRFTVLGEALFASPGTSDEKVAYAAADVTGAAREVATGDGSAMEEGGELVELELGAAIAACRTGDIPDMKTEVALLRLADHLGYLPQLGCFLSDLPPALRTRAGALGIERRGGGDGAG
jgi:ADP-ribose pyrophosphatase